MKRFFITATGTDIGKTFFTCNAIRQLREEGKNVHAIKPVMSGYEENRENDTHHILQALGKEISQTSVEAISPWKFKAPLSPDMAAAQENTSMHLNEIVDFCRSQITDILLIEGIGGLMVPLNQKHTVLDWIVRMDCPVILLAGTYVGTLSHTLTALEALRARKISPHAVILSESENSAATCAQTEKTLSHFLPSSTRLLSIPRISLVKESGYPVPSLTSLFL